MKLRVYIHSAGPWYRLFMTPENMGLLASFSEVVSDGERSLALPSPELAERISGCNVILSLNGYGAREITPEVLRSAGTVQIISVAHTWGQFESLTDDLGITVVEGSNAGTVAVAEWCLTAALMGIRKIDVYDAALKSGSAWAEPRRTVGMLNSETVGLIGLGRIGLYVARMFRSLGINVIAYSRSCTQQAAEELGLRLVSLDELLQTASIVSLHHAVSGATGSLLGAREFRMLKDGCVLINSARSAVYDENALVRELQTGRFSAFLDVFDEEPLPLDHPLRKLRNVTLTPHIAGNNREMFRRCAFDSIQGLKKYSEGLGLQDRRYSYP